MGTLSDSYSTRTWKVVSPRSGFSIHCHSFHLYTSSPLPPSAYLAASLPSALFFRPPSYPPPLIPPPSCSVCGALLEDYLDPIKRLQNANSLICDPGGLEKRPAGGRVSVMGRSKSVESQRFGSDDDEDGEVWGQQARTTCSIMKAMELAMMTHEFKFLYRLCQSMIDSTLGHFVLKCMLSRWGF